MNDSIEEVIRKMIESSQKMIGEQNNNPAINKHFELQNKKLQREMDR
jgi:hypothetical protein